MTLEPKQKCDWRRQHIGEGIEKSWSRGVDLGTESQRNAASVQRGLRVGWPGFTLGETVGTNRPERFCGGVALAGRGPPQLAGRARALAAAGGRGAGLHTLRARVGTATRGRTTGHS